MPGAPQHVGKLEIVTCAPVDHWLERHAANRAVAGAVRVDDECSPGNLPNENSKLVRCVSHRGIR